MVVHPLVLVNRLTRAGLYSSLAAKLVFLLDFLAAFESVDIASPFLPAKDLGRRALSLPLPKYPRFLLQHSTSDLAYLQPQQWRNHPHHPLHLQTRTLRSISSPFNPAWRIPSLPLVRSSRVGSPRIWMRRGMMGLLLQRDWLLWKVERGRHGEF